MRKNFPGTVGVNNFAAGELPGLPVPFTTRKENCTSRKMASMKFRRPGFICMLILLIPILLNAQAATKTATNQSETVQAQIILTVSESKRLIAKAVAQMPQVKQALQSGMLIIAKGTTNTYVAEEITGRSVAHGGYVYGRVFPRKGGKRFHDDVERIPEFILKNGKIAKDLSYAEAVKQLQAGDVVIKGANALDYANKTAGVMIGAGDGGTTGKFMPYLVAKKAHLIIPVGLEKLVAGNVLEVSNKMRQPMKSLNSIPSMFLLSGEIVTEIEALKILAQVNACQVGAGGIGGAEGAVRLLVRGPVENVNRALSIVEKIQGEPPFVK